MYMATEQLQDQSRSVSAFNQLHHMLPKILKSSVCTTPVNYTNNTKLNLPINLVLITFWHYLLQFGAANVKWFIRMKILNYWNVSKTTVDPVGSHECGTWDLTLRGEHRLFLKKKKGCWGDLWESKWKGNEQTCIMDRYIVYTSCLNIVSIIKLDQIRWPVSVPRAIRRKCVDVFVRNVKVRHSRWMWRR
jgi:hypothetical protein